MFQTRNKKIALIALALTVALAVQFTPATRTDASDHIDAPTLAHDLQARSWYGRLERHALSPGGLMDLMQINLSLDYRHLLGSVKAPTLVIHRSDEVVPVAGARYIASHIAGAQLIELPGQDHFVWAGDWRPLAAAVSGLLHSLPSSLTPQASSA